MIDQVINETTLAFTDLTARSVELGRSTNDSLSVSSDAIALALTYQYSLLDGLDFADQLFSVSAVYARLGADALTVSDTVAAGLIKDYLAQDTLGITETLHTETQYFRAFIDSLSTTDEVYPWVNGILQVAIGGDSYFNAVALIRNPVPTFKPAIPLKTPVGPRLPVEVQHSFVVTTPVRNRG